jgi:cyanophycinase
MVENHNGRGKGGARKSHPESRRSAEQKANHKDAKPGARKNGRAKSERVSEKVVGKSKGARAERAKRTPAGSLFVIGGAEDKHDTKVILCELAKRIGSGKLVISTLASEYGDELWEVYGRLFAEMGVQRIEHLGIDHRDDSTKDPRLDTLEDATAVFFTGGDQLRITTRLGGTSIAERIEEIYRQGGIVAGTSAGATAIGEMMLVGSPGGGISKVGDALQMTPGLGLAKNLIIDQHFSERGRIRRLLGAVAQNPRMLGIGIDEDTAVIMENDGKFFAVGSGAVYVVDGHDLTYTNISTASFARALSVFNVKLHVLCNGDCFDLNTRLPAHIMTEADDSELERLLIEEEIA